MGASLFDQHAWHICGQRAQTYSPGPALLSKYGRRWLNTQDGDIL